MTVTIGSFSTNALTTQPYGYDGEARRGLTSRAFRISGLLTAAQWAALLSEYNTWRNSRINDADSLKSQSIGTTVSLTSSSANGISISSLACWFSEAPSGEQLGAYVSASAVLVDAAEALAALLRERELAKEAETAAVEEPVDCAKIAAELQRRKDETDCELTALSGGLADDFATQAVTREVLDKTAQLAALGTYGQALADLDAQIEVQNKTTSNAVAGTYAAELAELDLARQVIDTEAKAALYGGTGAAGIAALKTAEIDIEIAESDARVAALAPKLETLKTSRSLLALYEKYLTEDLPNFGSESVGPVTLTLLKPSESRSAGPSVSLTATGNTYISGALGTLIAKDVEGYTTSLSASSLMSWYDSVVATSPAPGSWFPSSAPSIRTEKVLVEGLVGTRYIVNVTLVQIT